eukprot:m.17434 g.17434  ORF g.17434 m.17434 type:complete len:329 (+) comp8142_c0_seq1:64-1050(+)
MFKTIRELSEGVNPWLVFWMTTWYLCSLVTLFMNKIILSSEGGNKYVLGISQMVMTATLGGMKVYGPRLISSLFGTRPTMSGSDVTKNTQRHSTFWRDMVFVGVMRGMTVIFGLVSLAHVAVSFTETIKSSAPFFTVLFANLILEEKTSWQVNVALIPVMLGLVLCSATELSFDMIGFTAAVANNIVDCVQNVFSKHLLKSLTPVQLQFYTSAAAALLQLPMLIYTLAPQLKEVTIPSNIWIMIIIDSIVYHLQSVSAYYTMHHMRPVSQSVANTVKRALLIVLSILWFGNPMTLWSSSGIFVVFIGVFAYNHARLTYPPPTQPSLPK